MTEEGNSQATAEDSAKAVATTKATRPTDRWSVREAEIKKQKRKARRRKIKVSNTPG